MAITTAAKQVSDVLPEDRSTSHSSHKRVRVTTTTAGGVSYVRAGGCTLSAPQRPHSSPGEEDQTRPQQQLRGMSPLLPPVPETPATAAKGGGACGGWRSRTAGASGNSYYCASPRSASPAPSSSSTFSAATTSATFSSRASLSSCRSSNRSFGRSFGASGSSGGSSRSFSRPSSSSAFSSLSSSSSSGKRESHFPAPLPSSWDAGRRRRGAWYGGARDRSSGWGELERAREASRRRSRKDYASEARAPRDGSRSRSRGFCGRKRSRSGSRERVSRGKASAGVECGRCRERCQERPRERKITRTLPMEYWVRTPACKAAKSLHMEYMDNLTFSREQFIEETVFTCPFTGDQRDIVLERNMFPYDVPTDVEHWTLWSRKDLEVSEMEAFVQKWAAENHPHVVEWECDNNEGDRSIDWYHVHVFFRFGCQDRAGAPRDPTSVYDGPCGTPPVGSGSSDGEVSAATDGE